MADKKDFVLATNGRLNETESSLVYRTQMSLDREKEKATSIRISVFSEIWSK